MRKQYIIGIDQSTQGTKALLFDKNAVLVDRVDISHEQKISREGYISHDLNEIYQNTVQAVKSILERNHVKPGEWKGIGISNQRETTAAWNRSTGEPICDAVVWQCGRAEEICGKVSAEDAKYIEAVTGIPLSPFFPAAKMAWILKHVEEAKRQEKQGNLCMGTIDSWLVYKLTEGISFRTDYSNASRTQLLNLDTLQWDKRLLKIFGIPEEVLPALWDSDGLFGLTDLNGYWSEKVPIRAVMGDSHAALYGQGCQSEGMMKASYGTGSSLMMNTGKTRLCGRSGLVTSIAWKISGEVSYVLEGNINYTGAVITWLINNLKLIESAADTEQLARLANSDDTTYLVPAFGGLGAPYWNVSAKAMFYGMKRNTGRNELVKAALDCIAYQITDLLKLMEAKVKWNIQEFRTDGGATKNAYLMQFQSDISNKRVDVSQAEEMSGIGVACLAGMRLGLWNRDQLLKKLTYVSYFPQMEAKKSTVCYQGWKEAVNRVLDNTLEPRMWD